MFALLLVVSYYVGAFPFAVLVGRILGGVDVRREGSGNAGAMNTLRSAGPVAGALVALLDAAKAALPVIIGRRLFGPEAGALAGCAAVLGHCFSPYLIVAARRAQWNDWKMALRRTGGKGLAAGMGMLLAVAWPVAALAAVIFAATYAMLRTDATWPSVIGTVVAAPAMWLWTGSLQLGVAALVVALVVTVKHLPDLREGFYVDAQE